MNDRGKLIAAMLEGNGSFTELCERFGISRKQGYKWKGAPQYPPPSQVGFHVGPTIVAVAA
jgi:hypothetical protein